MTGMPAWAARSRASETQVHEHHVHVGKHLGGGFAVFAVQAINGYSQFRIGVAFPFDHVVLGVSLDAVLRAKKGRKLEELAVVLLEKVESIAQIREDGCRVKDGTEALAFKICGENFFKTCKGEGNHEKWLVVKGG